MIIRKYIVKDMNEAMAKIRFELGKDAIIISQNKVKQPGVFGIFKSKLIEVTAALENTQQQAKKEADEEKEFQESVNNIKKIMEEQINSQNKEEKQEETENNIRDEVKEMKAMLNEVMKNTSGVATVSEEVEYLRSLDIDDEFIEEVLNAAKEKNIEFKDAVKEVMSSELSVCSEELKGRVVLVGPTGVGKTTTIAKLAGRLALNDKKKVGLITIDTYRIGAVEQLKTYAEIMNIPFKVVITIKDMEEAISDLSNCDVILIDTTGRSSKNAMQLSELRAFIKKANPDQTALVVSCITKNKDLRVILEGYKDLDYEKVIITKLDETSAYGSLYNICKLSDKPISHITTGQNVPEDIKEPKIEDLVSVISGEEYLC
ncbi:MAG: flagellar biosynthesis protein FlhF [Clostridium sp.]